MYHPNMLKKYVERVKMVEEVQIAMSMMVDQTKMEIEDSSNIVTFPTVE